MKCKEYVKSERQEHVMDQWNNIMYSNTEDEYDVRLKHFESVCGDILAFLKYGNETWLVPYMERFVAAWTNKVTHLGNTTTNSWEAVNTMLKLQLGSIKASFQKSIVNTEHRYNTPFYSKFHSFVSRQCIQLIGNELEIVKFVGSRKERCGCYIRTTHGFPCACQLAGFQILGTPIPLEIIHIFWTKQFSQEEGNWDLEDECEELKSYFKKKCGSQTSKRLCSKPNGTQSSIIMIVRQPTVISSRAEFLPQFPAFFQPNIEDIISVDDDGNYSFCCVSASLGWEENSCPLVRRQLDSHIHQNADLFSRLFYDTVSEVRKTLEVTHLGG
ncbi:uncharacterized protein LOC131657468 [Vicia villosa]|uniref:uncharacterized protein LOC131657468 n=1 Tax=Vicia villosa TaxID=3911 RepID=UPI00273B8D74|nr:uncharacterized protein LOC131657468 [Vicia villosa]